MQIRISLRILAVSLLLTVGQLYGQVDTGVILGTVKDQSGAVVPGANVTLQNQGTGLSVSLTTSGDGSYVFRPVKIGTYTLEAQFKGFETVKHTDVTVDVQQQVVVNFTLQPGQVTESIQVTGAPPALQTQDASVGQVVGSRTINDLPLNGRNYTFLAQLSAGITQDQQDTRGLGASGSFAANGTRPAQNNYLLDGIDDNADLVDFLNGTAYVVRPPVDAIQEFKVQTSDYSAEMGRSAGAVVNAAIKSGSNQFHGNAWEFVRNDIFDAANFFENSPTPTPKGEYRQNQFGATIGGPIRRDKTFFFGDYEGTRVRQAIPNVSAVPTALQRSSGYTNLSELISGQAGGTPELDLLNRTFPLGTVFDPATTRAVTCGATDSVSGITPAGAVSTDPCFGMAAGTQVGYARDPMFATPQTLTGVSDFTTAAWAGLLNQLPGSRLDPNAISLLNLFPSPTSSSLYNNYSSDPVLRNTVNQFDARVDQNFSDKDQLFGRVSFSDNREFLPGPFTGIADGGSFSEGTQTVVSINMVLSETHAFSPTLVNEARLGFSRIGASRVQPYATTLGIPAKYGIQGVPQVTDNGGLGSIFITGLNTLGSNEFLPSVEYNSTLQFTDNLTKVHGKQTLKGGMEFQHLKFSILQPPEGRGDWTFSGAFTNVPETGAGNTGMAQMLILPEDGTVTGAYNMVGGADDMGASNYANTDMGRNYYGYYFQDDWKATSKLTLNLGVRYECFGQIQENYGAQSEFIPSGGSGPSQFILTKHRCNTPLSADFLAAAQTDNIDISCSSQPGLGYSQLGNFSPRVGFAYQITPRLVARGGFGLFYGGFENSVVETYVDFPFQFSLGYPSLTTAQPITFSNGTFGTLETGLSAIVPLTSAAAEPSGVSFTGEDHHMKTAYTEGYNLALQYEVTTNQTFQVNYVGNTVRHLGVYINPNSPSEILPPGLNSYAYSPYPDFQNGITYTSMAGDSYYNSLQATFERRFNAGLDLLANFTYSACRTDAVDVLNATAIASFRAAELPHFGVQGDYGRCDFDIPKVVHVSGSYELPVGKGKRFLTNGGRLADGVLGGWKTNGILTLQDGMPGTIGCVNSTTSGYGCNALLVPGQSIIAGPHNVNDWLNAAAFTSPPVATTIGQSDYSPLGGAPGQFYGPGYHRIDFSLFKNFSTSDKTRLEFRAEIFNLINHPNFSPPGFGGNGVVAAPGSTDYTSPSTFGTISSTRDGQNDQREIQFALKFYF